MERKIKPDTSKPLWKKVAGGSLRLRKPLRRIKPGEKVRLTKEELGKHIDQFELLEDPTKKKEKEPVEDAEENANEETQSFELIKKGWGSYDVLDIEGNVMNTEKLNKAEAEKFKTELEDADKTNDNDTEDME